jgi:hypothetical protein
MSSRNSAHVVLIEEDAPGTSVPTERIKVQGPKGEKQPSFIKRSLVFDKQTGPHDKKHKRNRREKSWIENNYSKLLITLISLFVSLSMFFLNKLFGGSAGYIGFLEVPLFMWCAVPVGQISKQNVFQILIV